MENTANRAASRAADRMARDANALMRRVLKEGRCGFSGNIADNAGRRLRELMAALWLVDQGCLKPFRMENGINMPNGVDMSKILEATPKGRGFFKEATDGKRS